MAENLSVLADITNTTPALNPFMDIVQTIIDIPEEHLTPTTIESLEGAIRGAMTPSLKKQSVEQIIQNYKNDNVSRGEVLNELNSVITSVDELIMELKVSDTKARILHNMFNAFFEVFEEVKERYINYDIELLMSLEPNAIVPTYAHETDAAADLYALEDTSIPANSRGNKIRTGVRIALPENWVAYIVPRSSTGSKTPLRLSNSVGVIDADYRGEIGVLYDNISDSDYKINVGDRIAQLIVMPSYHFKANIVDILPATERGEGGFGSTGQ